MAAAPWRRRLYEQLGAVAVDGPRARVELLDVFVKVDDGARGAYIARAGSATELGRHGDEFEWDYELLVEGLDTFKRTQRSAEGDGQFRYEWSKFTPHPPITEHTGPFWARDFLTALNLDAELRRNGGAAFRCKLEDLKLAAVDKFELLDFMLDERWKPDTAKSALRWPPPGRGRRANRGRELWVVHEILYAERVIVEPVDRSAGTAPPREVHPAGAPEFEVKPTASGGFEFTAPPGQKPFAFAFRAILLEYNGEGDLVDLELYGDGLNPQAGWTDANREENERRHKMCNLGGFFVDPAADLADPSADLRMLDVVDLI